MNQNNFLQKINFYLILIIVFALPSYLVRFEIFGIPTTLLEVLIYIVFVLTIVSSIKYKVASQKFSIFNFQFSLNSPIFQFSIPIILFIIAGIIGVVVSSNKNAALGQFKALIFDPVLFFITLIINFRLSNQKTSTPLNLYTFKPILQALILGGALVAIHAIWQKATGQVAIDGRVIGIFGYSPNYLSLYLTPIAVLTVGYELLLIGNDWKNYYFSKKIWIYDTAFLLMLIAIYFSGSRAGLAVVMVTIIFLFFARFWQSVKKSKVLQALLYCFIVLILIGGYFAVKPDFSLSQNEGGRIVSSNNVRWQIWDTSVKMLSENNKWLSGVGLGNYQEYFSQFSKGWVNFDEYISPNALTAHNLYLQTWFNIGLLGIIAFIWIIILFFRYSLFAIRQNKNLNSYFLILISVMFSILLYGLLDTPYWKNDLAVMFWLLVGLTFIINKNELKNENK